MIVSDVIALAQNAELKQLAVASNKVAILGFINLGVLELHKRFNLIQQEAIINMVEGKFLYRLDGTDVDVDITIDPNRLLRVDDVYDYDGSDICINDEDDAYSVATPQYNVVEIPEVALTPTMAMSVIYRAAPNFLTNEKALVPIPPQFLEALMSYIGYRGHSSLRGDKEFENNTHYNRFERSCAQIKADGMHIDDSLKSHKFEPRGFV